MVEHSEYSIFESAEVMCGGCRQEFKTQIPVVINATHDNHLVQGLINADLLTATCPFCGESRGMPNVFLFHDQQNKRLLLIVPNGYQNRFLFAKQLLKNRIEKYKAVLPIQERDKLLGIKTGIIPEFAFLKRLGSQVVSGGDQGIIHLSPLPGIELLETVFVPYDTELGVQVAKEEIVFAKGNVPSYFLDFWDFLEKDINFRKFYFHTRTTPLRLKTVGTYGLLELVFFVGSNIVLPVFLGVLSNLLFQVIIDKRKAKKTLKELLEEARRANDPYYPLLKKHIDRILELQTNEMKAEDEVTLRLRCVEVQKEYVSRGTFTEVQKDLAKLRLDLMSSIYMPGNCHVCNWATGFWIDSMLEKDNVGTLDTIPDHFGRMLGKETRVRIVTGNWCNHFNETYGACEQAKKLMVQKKWEEAARILGKCYIGEGTRIDVIFNLAQCMLRLGKREEALVLFDRFIVASMNLPNLKESTDILLGK